MLKRVLLVVHNIHVFILLHLLYTNSIWGGDKKVVMLLDGFYGAVFSRVNVRKSIWLGGCLKDSLEKYVGDLKMFRK